MWSGVRTTFFVYLFPKVEIIYLVFGHEKRSYPPLRVAPAKQPFVLQRGGTYFKNKEEALVG